MKKNIGEFLYSDIAIGDFFETASRTITDADIMQFAGLTGDYNELHTSDTYAQKTPYKQRIAHGLLTMSIANGLYMRLGYFHSVFLEMKHWRFMKPVYVGDTIRVTITLLEKRLTKNSDKGILDWKYEVMNQSDAIVAEGILVRMINAVE